MSVAIGGGLVARANSEVGTVLTRHRRATTRLFAATVAALLLLPVFAGALTAAPAPKPTGTWSVSNATVVEGDTTVVTLHFTITYTRSATDSGNVHVHYATVDVAGGATGASNCNSGTDYQRTSGNADGDSSASFVVEVYVNVCGDLVPESDETLELALDSASNDTVIPAPGYGIGTIVDNDSKTATTTSVTSNINPSVVGQSVTLTATVSAAAATGTVQFQVDGSDIGSPVTVSAGTASITTSLLTAGSRSVVAVYSGDSTYAGSTSPAYTQNVNATGSVDHIVISPKTHTTTAGVAVNYSAEAWDAYGHDLGDVTSSTTFDITSPGGCLSNACGSNTPGGFTVTATYSGKSDTASLTVDAGPVDHIVISPATATITAGDSQDYTAEAFDWVGNSLGDVTGSTTFDFDGSPCSGASCGPTTAGDYTVTGTYSGKTGTASLAVDAGALDHIVISPATATITAGDSQGYTAEAYDAYGNHWSVTGSTTFDYDGSPCSGASCGPTTAGTYTVTGTYSGKTDTASLTVDAAGVDHIVISPATATITAGDSQAYTAEAFDGVGNSLGDVTSSTAFDYDGTPCSGASCGPTTAGDYTVTGTYSGKTDTASLTVDAAGVDHIVISPASATITAGDSQAYTAEGYDAYSNDLGDVTSSTAFDYDGTPCSGASCGPTTVGTYTVTGTYGGGSSYTVAGTYTIPSFHSTATGTASLTVDAGPLDHIVISPASATITAGDSQAYTAEGYDAYSNDLGDVTSSTAFDYDGTPCSGASCGPSAAGTYTVTGTYSGLTDTASLTVNAAGVDHIVISPASATITAGASQAYTAEAFDGVGNSLGDVTGSTAFDYDGTSCGGSSCGPTTAGTYTVTGTYSGKTDTASLTVEAGALDHIVISPDNQTIDLGNSQAYSAEAFDAYGNSLGAVVASYTLDGDPCSGDTCMPATAGAHAIVGSYAGHTDSTSLTVNPAGAPSEDTSANPSASSEESASESGADPTQPGTAPATGSSGSDGSNGTTPLFAMLICAAFGALALVTVQAQRKAIRR